MGKDELALWKATFVAGSCAGLLTDVVLFPLDTVKTRMQSELGFRKTGGFTGVYKGLGSVATASVPNAALFFLTYETGKHVFGSNPLTQSLSASLGEVVACIVRVPCEVVKQRAQARKNMTSLKALTLTVQSEGLRGLYRGYWTTVLREVPFSFIQLPLWELIKKEWSFLQKKEVNGWQSGVAGGISGMAAAALTTPLDVVKTRLMLAEQGSSILKLNPLQIMVQIARQRGISGLFAGLVPRVTWLGVGGLIFLGVYDETKLLLTRRHYNKAVLCE